VTMPARPPGVGPGWWRQGGARKGDRTVISLYVEASPVVLLAGGMVLGGTAATLILTAVRAVWRRADPTIDR
jgi:hypothetical protein